MSDIIREECGLALIRLRKPLSYYQEKYGTPLWGLYNLFLLMEKQHNRGQDGAGVGALKLDVTPGKPYMFRERNIEANPLDKIFHKVFNNYNRLTDQGIVREEDTESIKNHFDFAAEIYMGHLRYGTSGGYNISSCHPYFRKNNWPTRNLMLAGNFNMTNTSELNYQLIERGQHPVFDTDTQTLLEEIGYHLDQGHDKLFKKYKSQEGDGAAIANRISEELNPAKLLRKSCQNWDGGFALVGIIGNGDSFAFRDPRGIRPLHYYINDEVVAFASERAPLLTVFNINQEDVEEVNPGEAVIMKYDGSFYKSQVDKPYKKTHCSFERIYFSRGNDPDIYQERKDMGAALLDQILKVSKNDPNKIVYSFIPNTAEIAYYGLMNRIREHQRELIKKEILEMSNKEPLNQITLDSIFDKYSAKLEKVTLKDIKLRTFISQEKGRNKLASHVYDISYGSVPPDHTLVCVDDSIVRGTTLKKSIIQILSRLNPKRIVIASTAPQIRYPDCYGIDMSQLEKFIAFQAVLELLKEHGKEGLIKEVYDEAKELLAGPTDKLSNPVTKLYSSFKTTEISKKISQLVTPNLPDWDGDVAIVFQKIENLHKCLRVPCGDWYFTGKYPTTGGYRVVNKAYCNFYENKNHRSY